jgi:asparagine synthase (glutamine-hydrolysing)
MISDVPLGAFLSGGIDSSAVVGFMAEESKEPVKTFSIGFEESGFSELNYARLIAKRFKTDHHEFIVKPQMAEMLPKIAHNYSQPFADPSALPSYYVAHETRKHVTVALNGDGGDENFGGYLRYQADKIFCAVARIPAPLRSAAAGLIARMPPSFRVSRIARRVLRAGSILGSDPHEFNFKLFCYFDQEAENALFEEPLLALNRDRNVMDYFLALYEHSDSDEFMDQVLACDAQGYLPDCLLVKMDIASMSNSLEARSPFLDHKVMEFAARIPAEHKVKWNGGKWILKRALRGFIPDEVLFRRKMGFGIPLAEWFRGPLKDFLRDHVLSGKARQRGYFKMAEVERLVDEHQKGARDHGYKLWALLMLELWHEAYVDGQKS